MVKAIIKKIAKDDDLGLNKSTVFFQWGLKVAIDQLWQRIKSGNIRNENKVVNGISHCELQPA